MDLVIPKPGKSREPCFLVGIHADLARWVHRECSDKKSLVYKALVSKHVSEESVTEVLGLQNPFDRRLKASEAIKTLWMHHPELGPCPILDTLSALEDERVFYKDYREHACLHQFLVYLLGVYVFSQNSFVRTSVQREIQREGAPYDQTDEETLEKEFLRRWLVVATAHDVGYILESAKTDPSQNNPEYWDNVKAPIQVLFKEALRGVRKVADIMAPGWEAKWRNSAHVHTPDVETPEYLLEQANLAQFDDLAIAVGMGNLGAKDLLSRYYEFARKNAPRDRSQFRDHGITSACLVGAVFDHYHEKVRRVLNWPGTPAALRKFMDKQIQKKQADAKATMKAACGAIALHNLDPDLWQSKGTAGASAIQQEGLFPTRLRFSLDKAALAFLLRFCDGLQDWGRPKFRARMKDDPGRELQAHDISVQGGANSGNPLRTFLRNSVDSRGAVLSGRKRFDAFKDDVWKYLDEKDLRKMVSSGGAGSTGLSVTDLEGKTKVSAGKKTPIIKKPSLVVVPPFSPEEKKMISALTGKKMVNETEIVCCPHNGRCPLRRHSIVTAAELVRVGAAYDETVVVWELVGDLEHAAHHLRKALEERQPPIVLLPRFDSTQSAVRGLVRYFEPKAEWDDLLGNPQKTPKLKKFLLQRATDDDEKAVEDLISSLHYLYREFKDADDDVVQKKLGYSAVRGVIKALRKSSGKVRLALREVIRSRTSGTYKTIKKKFEKGFDGKKLGFHFEQVNRELPHRNSDHLRIPS
jgi:hypothetical protein